MLLTAGLSLQSPYSACVGLLGHQIEIFKPLQQAISTTFSYKFMVLVGWLPHRLKHGLRTANTDVTGKLNLEFDSECTTPRPFSCSLGKAWRNGIWKCLRSPRNGSFAERWSVEEMGAPWRPSWVVATMTEELGRERREGSVLGFQRGAGPLRRCSLHKPDGCVQTLGPTWWR